MIIQETKTKKLNPKPSKLEKNHNRNLHILTFHSVLTLME